MTWIAFFGLKLGLDLEMRAAHPHQKFQGVPPGREWRAIAFKIRHCDNSIISLFITMSCSWSWHLHCMKYQDKEISFVIMITLFPCRDIFFSENNLHSYCISLSHHVFHNTRLVNSIFKSARCILSLATHPELILISHKIHNLYSYNDVPSASSSFLAVFSSRLNKQTKTSFERTMETTWLFSELSHGNLRQLARKVHHCSYKNCGFYV